MKLLQVKDIMSSPVETISSQTHTMQDAANLMMKKKIGSLLVIDPGNITSIITERDIVRAVADENLTGGISEYMASPLVTIHENAILADAAQLMLGKHIRRLPVIDDRGKISGIINMRDITEAIQGEFIELLSQE